MAIERWEIIQRQKGNNAAADMARALRDHFGDVPLMDESSEQFSGIQRFSPEIKSKIEKLDSQSTN